MIVSDVREVCYTSITVYGVPCQIIEKLQELDEEAAHDGWTYVLTQFEWLNQWFEDDPDQFSEEFITLVKPLLDANEVDEIFFIGETNNAAL